MLYIQGKSEIFVELLKETDNLLPEHGKATKPITIETF